MKNLVLIVLIGVISCTGAPEAPKKEAVTINYDITREEWKAMPDSLKYDWMYKYIYFSNDEDVQSMIEFAKNEIRNDFKGEGEVIFIDAPDFSNGYSILNNNCMIKGKVKGPNEAGGSSIREFTASYKITPYKREVVRASLDVDQDVLNAIIEKQEAAKN
jgi:hypothetical protein